MAFISEIHYQNSYASSSRVSEFVEIALNPTEAARAADFQLTTYNLDGTVIDNFNLGSITPVIDPVSGLHIYTFETVTTDPNGSAPNNAEAIALTDSTQPDPVSFFDIGGGTTNITATEGPAAGATSTNIPAAPAGNSIQFDNEGNRTDGTLTRDSAVCIADGTDIATAKGQRRIEHLLPGDLIVTRDNGLQPLRWKYARRLRLADLRANPALRPICIRAGALGRGLPWSDLRVSPQHRMLIETAHADLLFGDPRCLVKAKHLADRSDRIFRDRHATGVVYNHLLFDRHEIIFANGAPTESFLPGATARGALDAEECEELAALFPDLVEMEQADVLTLRHWEAKMILAHIA